MDAFKGETDDEYWTGSLHSGFDFSDGDVSRLCTVKKDGGVSHLDLLQYDGFNEVAESKNESTSNDLLASHIVTAYELSDAASSLPKKHDCLQFDIKEKDSSGKPIISVKDTVKNIIIGQDYSLECYKGREIKVELLKAAVKSHDGNAITAVVLFMRNTLKRAVFQREIISFPEATSMYICYLEEEREVDELMHMLLLIGKGEEAAMLKYKAAILVKNPESKLKWLENCLSTHFQVNYTDNFLRSLVRGHHDLLLKQVSFEKYHTEYVSSIDETIKKVFLKLTQNSSIVASPAMSTLIFSLLYFSNLSGGNEFCPVLMKRFCHFSHKQYTWALVRSMAALKRWEVMKELFSKKGWFGAKKMRCCIGFSRVVDVLAKEKAPLETLGEYIHFVDDDEEKLNLAKKHKCKEVVIEMLRTLRDRQGLLEYRESLHPCSEDYRLICDILRHPLIKWKN